jgi:hypothetical protein
VADHNPQPALVNVSSESLAFFAPSATLAPFQGRVLEVFPSNTRLGRLKNNCLSDTPDLGSSSKPTETKPNAEAFCLSWDSSGFRPSIDTLTLRKLPASEDAFGPSLLRDRSCSALVDSHHLDGLLRNGAAGLLRPAADHGVRSVSLCDVPPSTEADGEPRHRSRYALPFEEFPSSTAVPRHRGRCLPGVTISRARHPRATRG